LHHATQATEQIATTAAAIVATATVATTLITSTRFLRRVFLSRRPIERIIEIGIFDRLGTAGIQSLRRLLTARRHRGAIQIGSLWRVDEINFFLSQRRCRNEQHCQHGRRKQRAQVEKTKHGATPCGVGQLRGRQKSVSVERVHPTRARRIGVGNAVGTTPSIFAARPLDLRFIQVQNAALGSAARL
jgi:hypothetical protein